MMNPYNYLYYKLYKFAKKVVTVDATWTAMLLMSALIYFNISTIAFWIIPIEKIIVLPIWLMAVLIAGPLILINYFIFIYKDRCKFIIIEYENKSKSEKIWSSIITIVYIILTWYLAHKN